MSIKVGDLVMVVRHCCEDRHHGKITVVEHTFVSNGFCTCGVDHRGADSALLRGVRDTFRLSWLIKLPPLSEPTTHREEIVA